MANEQENKDCDEKLEKESNDDSHEKENEEDNDKKPNDELAKIKEDLVAKENELAEYISHIQRLQADFENFKKQTEKQNRNIIKFANENLIKNILDSYEDFERALKNSKTKEELKEGVELIHSKLKNTLEKEGLKEIPAKGEKFDPFKHEALLVENNKDFENGEIIEELMKGYTLKDKVIKYSKVKVCKK